MNYPLTLSGVLNFLQCYNLTGNRNNMHKHKNPKQLTVETAFVTDGNDDKHIVGDKKSDVC